jgi:hypothetical protein
MLFHYREFKAKFAENFTHVNIIYTEFFCLATLLF